LPLSRAWRSQQAGACSDLLSVSVLLFAQF
jgi:hypothetical protein